MHLYTGYNVRCASLTPLVSYLIVTSPHFVSAGSNHTSLIDNALRLDQPKLLRIILPTTEGQVHDVHFRL